MSQAVSEHLSYILFLILNILSRFKNNPAVNVDLVSTVNMQKEFETFVGFRRSTYTCYWLSVSPYGQKCS